jgi:hypothetical protein
MGIGVRIILKVILEKQYAEVWTIFQLTQYRNQLQVVLNVIKNLWLPLAAENFLISWAAVISKSSLLHGFS